MVFLWPAGMQETMAKILSTWKGKIDPKQIFVKLIERRRSDFFRHLAMNYCDEILKKKLEYA